MKLALPLMSQGQPLVIGLDDTITRKTGRRIPKASTLRDPLSPPYHTNLVWALRFIQAVLLLWPADGAGAARAIPIAFDLAPPVPKPKPKPKRKKASKTAASADKHDNADAKQAAQRKAIDEEWKQYYKLRRQQGLSAQGAALIQQTRSRLDALAGYAERILWAVVDASYCNRTVLSRLPERTILIGRTRIAPLAYPAHGHRLYRDPAYLLVTDPQADAVQVLQAYFYRWEIEADQKEEQRFAWRWPGSSLVRASGLPPACASCRLLRHAPVGRHPVLRSKLDSLFVTLALLAVTQTSHPSQRYSTDRHSPLRTRVA